MGRVDADAPVTEPGRVGSALRERHPDLRVETGKRALPANELRRLRRENEAVREGRVAVGVVRDPAGRVLLADIESYDGWTAPGGTALPGESLADATAREVYEETGVCVTPTRPHLVYEETMVAESGDAEPDDGDPGSDPATLAVAFFGARAADPAVGDPAELGDPDETVRAVEWFETLPEDVYDRERVAAVLSRPDAE